MNNKVLIKIYFPQLEKNFDVFIPVNELVWKVEQILLKSAFDLSNIELNDTKYVLINKNTGRIYNNNEIIIKTDIRNGTELLFLPI